MDALDCLMTRRSIRRYTDAPVEREQIETVLAAAMAAPSAGNQQPWRFVVLTERDRLDAAAETTPYGKMLLEAAFALVVCADTRELKHDGMWQQDCSAATQNALLAAHAIGLGGVWLGFWPKMERVTPLKEVLGMPGRRGAARGARVRPSCRGEGALQSATRPSFVHYERW